ncbi:MAG: alpha/beta hydrolase [Rickettsiaceae bacterium]|nr:alpha/beta hydrolase [Rickettsiaceae bacterium]
MKTLRTYNNQTLSYKQQYFNKDSTTILYVHGLMSDMHGFKSSALMEYCTKKQINFIAFDNLGHGQSSGNYLECNITTWRDGLIAIIKELNLKKCILVGSSMGGWISLLVAQMNMPEIEGLLLIAPGPDFTEKILDSLSPEIKFAMIEQSFVLNINNRYQINYQLLADGKHHLLLNQDSIKINVPVILMHGMEDTQIDYMVSYKLSQIIESPYLCAKISKYSTHRMGKIEDVALMLNSIDEIMSFNQQNSLD